jgi:hypothetical protein
MKDDKAKGAKDRNTEKNENRAYNFPEGRVRATKIRLKPKKRNVALTPNNKKLTHGTFRVAGNLAKTRE